MGIGTEGCRGLIPEGLCDAKAPAIAGAFAASCFLLLGVDAALLGGVGYAVNG